VQGGVIGNMSKPMRIGLVMQGGSGWMGGVEYIKNIVFALSTLPQEVKDKFEICLICDESMDSALYESVLPHVKDLFYTKREVALKRVLQKAQKVVFQQCPFSLEVATFLDRNPNHGIDFIYPYTPYKTVTQELIAVSWMADFQHKYLPHLFTFSDVFLRDISFKYISQKSQKVVVSSKSAKADFHKFFPTSPADVDVLSFTTFPLPEWYATNREEILNIYSLPKRFFLVSNQFWQHKNHELIFKAMAILKGMQIDVNIVCTGKLGDDKIKGYAQDVREMVSRLGLDKQVYILGLIPKNHQVQVMRSALAMIQPSLFEGWSTAVEDARCFGKKIALSNISVHLEQNPPGAVFFDKNNPTELANILSNWWESVEIGIDLEREVIAREIALKRIEQIAYHFLDIADLSKKSVCKTRST
jgi:glycosyltransferase involved in cell wall biosynthesis